MANQQPLESKFNGFCVECDEKYPAGTKITKRDGRWVHFNCFEAKEADLAKAADSILDAEEGGFGQTHTTQPRVYDDAPPF